MDARHAAARRASAPSPLLIPTRRVLALATTAFAAWACGGDGDEPIPPPADATTPLEIGLPDARSADAAPLDAAPFDAASLDATRDATRHIVDATPDGMNDATPPVDAAPDTALDPAPDAARPPIDMAMPDLGSEDDRELRCDDGLDGDGDGAVDCADGDCLIAIPCLGVPMEPVQRVQSLFLERCGCHTGEVALGDLSLVRPFTAATIGVPAVLDETRLLVEPGDHARSFLYQKIAGTHGPGRGELMPPEPPAFRPFETQLVADWIDSLAE